MLSRQHLKIFTYYLDVVGVDACIDPRADASIRPYKACA